MRRQTSIEVAALSDLGCKRSNNEDSFGYDPARRVYVVCDGMGGMAAGEVASQLAVATLLEAVAASDSAVPIEHTLALAIAKANEIVHQASQLPAHKGMGTTLVVAAVEDDELILANVGDSRAYVIRSVAPQQFTIEQLTVDHSYLNELIRSGTVPVENAGKVDLRGMESVITRAIGVSATVEPDFFNHTLVPGDKVLLASDGLTRYVTDAEIAQLVVTSTVHFATQDLIALARARGGADNITTLLLHVTREQKPEA